MENNITNLVSNQLPHYLQEESPLFVDFLKTYYQYVSQRNKSLGIIQNNSLDIDIDTTDDSYITKFLSTYGEFFPKTTSIDTRNFVKLLNQIYESKGTEKSLKLIFRLLFNDDVSVSYPNEQILIASSGKWVQESYVTVEVIYGQIPEMGFSLSLSNDIGKFELKITKIIRRPNNIIRMYYSTFDIVTIEENQSVFHYSSDGATLFIGKLIKTPSRVTIRNAGNNWQIGNVIAIGDETTPMIIRVVAVNSNGGITDVEILENGFVSPEYRLFAVSPYPNRPSGDSMDIGFEYDPLTGGYNHKISISEYQSGASDYIVGVSNNRIENSYFLEDYVEFGYDGYVSVLVSDLPTQFGDISSGLSIDEWLASRAIFYYDSDYIIKTKGYYKNSGGHLSNPEVRLQDNYYYQNFSYVIGTSRDINEYSQALNITHPAGTKRFSNIIKTYNGEISMESVGILDDNTDEIPDSLLLDSYNNLITDNFGNFIIINKGPNE